jgi:hypothetical protein
MVLEIEVFDDGDIFVTKRHKMPQLPTLLYFTTYEELKKELISYEVRDIDEDIKSIKDAEFNEAVRCY